MGDTSIEWTASDDGTPGKVWNPTSGCSIISPGCKNCYALQMAARFSDPGMWGHGFAERTPHGPRWTRRLALLGQNRIELPTHWKKPRRIFVNSASDLFHENLSNEQIAAVFGVMAQCPQHTFQVLTKRAKRMREWFEWVEGNGDAFAPEPDFVVTTCAVNFGAEIDQLARPWPLPNVWLGVSAESQEYADERIPELLATPAAVRFVSVEPMLGPVDLRRYLDASGRAGVSCAGGTGLVLGATGRNDLAAREMVARRDAEADSSLRGEGRAERIGRVSDDHVLRTDDQAASQGVRASHRLDGDQGAGHSGSDGGQSRGRCQVERASGQPHPDDSVSEREAWHTRAGSPEEGSGWRGERPGEVDRSSGGRGPYSLGHESDVSAADGGTLWREAEHDIGDRSAHQLEARGLDWVIVGGESGHGARPFNLAWARSVRDQCRSAGTAFFFKQAGANVFNEGIGLLDDEDPDAIDVVRVKLKAKKGGDPAELPEDLRVRQFPRGATC